MAVMTLVLSMGATSCPPKGGGQNQAGLRAAREGGGTPEEGARVPYKVQVENAPRQVSAFGMDIRYDPAQLEYTGTWERGELTEGFTQVGVNEISPGVLRVGGFTVGDPIAAEATGVLTTLEFTARAYAPTQLSVVNPVDDVEGFVLTAPASDKSKNQQ
jgi:hypothetical protein